MKKEKGRERGKEIRKKRMTVKEKNSLNELGNE